VLRAWMTRVLMSLDTAMESSTGSMVLTTRASGTSTKPKAKAPFGMLREMCIEVNSRMIWLMDMVNIHILTEVSTKVNSRTTSKKGTEKKNGLTAPSTWELMATE